MTLNCVLAIGGSTSRGDSGVQADLRTFGAMGIEGVSAITSITVHRAGKEEEILALPASIVAAQVDSIMSEVGPEVVKVGRLASVETVRTVAARLREWKSLAVVLDPVLVEPDESHLDDGVVEALREELLPLASIVTPNWIEAGRLIHAFPRGTEDIERIAISFRRLGVANILIKGGRLEGETIIDTLYEGDRRTEFTHRRIPGVHPSGAGWVLASAIAAGVALQRDLIDACREAIEFTHRAIGRRYDADSSTWVG